MNFLIYQQFLLQRIERRAYYSLWRSKSEVNRGNVNTYDHEGAREEDFNKHLLLVSLVGVKFLDHHGREVVAEGVIKFTLSQRKFFLILWSVLVWSLHVLRVFLTIRISEASTKGLSRIVSVYVISVVHSSII